MIRSFFYENRCQKVIHKRPQKFKKWRFRYPSDYNHFFNKMASKKQFHHSVPIRSLTDSKTLKLVEIILKNIKNGVKKKELSMHKQINITSIINKNHWTAKHIPYRRSGESRPLASQKKGRRAHRTIGKCEKKVQAKKIKNIFSIEEMENNATTFFHNIKIVEEIWTQKGSQKNKKTGKT